MRDRHGERKVSTQEAMLLKFCENALKGDPRALKTLVALMERYGDDPASTIDPTALAPDDSSSSKTTSPGSRRRSQAAQGRQVMIEALDAVLRADFENFLRKCTMSLSRASP